MANVSDLFKYKKAKVIVPELVATLGIIERTIKDLGRYRRYYPVLRSLETLEDSRLILIAHLREQKNILEKKGEE